MQNTFTLKKTLEKEMKGFFFKQTKQLQQKQNKNQNTQ